MADEVSEDYFNRQITKLIPKDRFKTIIALVADWHNL